MVTRGALPQDDTRFAVPEVCGPRDVRSRTSGSIPIHKKTRMRNRILLPLIAALAAAPAATQSAPPLSTFSIVACDPETGFWGVAVQSRVVGAGSIVPAAEADAGAIATQANANVSFKRRGLELLRQGRTAEEVRDEFVRGDSGI